jgi:ribosome-associated heat shock protein Hsp15
MGADTPVRLDKWLWAARFYKTRGVAAEAISGGKVEVNGSRAKRARPVHPGDRLRIRKGPFEFLIQVVLVSDRRGPPSQAAGLYHEDAAGRLVREKLALQLRIAPSVRYEGKGRPTKKDRRALERLEEND